MGASRWPGVRLIATLAAPARPRAVLKRVYVACGSDMTARGTLHLLAREAGLGVEDFRIGLRSNVDLGSDLFDWLIGITHMLHTPAVDPSRITSSSSYSETSLSAAKPGTPPCSASRR
jgi:hypothetical protein